MTNEMRDRIRARYLRDTTPVRLGGLAANLARVKTFSCHAGGRDAVESVIDESKHFIDWAGPELEIDVAAELLTLQRQLVRWQRHLNDVWDDPGRRHDLSEAAGKWSNRVLQLSGLLQEAHST
jgi:hypothetical protein